MLSVWRTRAYEQLGEPITQPTPFSHKHHVGDDGIDCRYCHTTVETAAHAGLPATALCLVEWRARPLQMQWCLDCHRDPAPRLRPQSQEFAPDAPPATPTAFVKDRSQYRVECT